MAQQFKKALNDIKHQYLGLVNVVTINSCICTSCTSVYNKQAICLKLITIYYCDKFAGSISGVRLYIIRDTLELVNDEVIMVKRQRHSSTWLSYISVLQF